MRLGILLFVVLGHVAQAYNPARFLEDDKAWKFVNDGKGKPVRLPTGQYLAVDYYGNSFTVDIADTPQQQIQLRAKLLLQFVEKSLGLPSSNIYPAFVGTKESSGEALLRKNDGRLSRAVLTQVTEGPEYKPQHFEVLDALHEKNPSKAYAYQVLKAALPSLLQGHLDASKLPHPPAELNAEEFHEVFDGLLERLKSFSPDKQVQLQNLLRGLDYEDPSLIDMKDFVENAPKQLREVLKERFEVEVPRVNRAPKPATKAHIWLPEAKDLESQADNQANSRLWKSFFSKKPLDKKQIVADQGKTLSIPQHKSFLMSPQLPTQKVAAPLGTDLPLGKSQLARNKKTLLVFAKAQSARELFLQDFLAKSSGAPVVRLSGRFVRKEDISQISAAAERNGVETILFSNAGVSGSEVMPKLQQDLGGRYRVKHVRLEHGAKAPGVFYDSPIRQFAYRLGLEDSAAFRHLSSLIFEDEAELRRSGMAHWDPYESHKGVRDYVSGLDKKNLGALANGAPLLYAFDDNSTDKQKLLMSQFLRNRSLGDPLPAIAGLHESWATPGTFDLSVMGDYELIQALQEAANKLAEMSGASAPPFAHWKRVMGASGPMRRWVVEGMSEKEFSQLRGVVDDVVKKFAKDGKLPIPVDLNDLSNKWLTTAYDRPIYMKAGGVCELIERLAK